MSADRLEIYLDETEDGWRWRRRAANGEIISSGESHDRRWNAVRAAARANPDVYRENVVDLTRGGLRVRSSALSGLRSRGEG